MTPIPTLAEIQAAWHRRWATEQPERPSCYNRPAFVNTVFSHEFQTQYEFRQSMDCAHWKSGGNAMVRPYCDSAGGKKTPWSACLNCKWKPE